VQGVLEALLVALEALEGVVVVMAVEADGQGEGGGEILGERTIHFLLVAVDERAKLGFVEERLGGLKSPEPPGDRDDAVHQEKLCGGLRSEFQEERVAEGVEGFDVFAFEAEVAAEDAVGGGVFGGFGFSFGSAGAGGFLGVGAVGGEFFLGNHDLPLLLKAREEREGDRQRDEDGVSPLSVPRFVRNYTNINRTRQGGRKKD
jgi:hypothetical protein